MLVSSAWGDLRRLHQTPHVRRFQKSFTRQCVCAGVQRSTPPFMQSRRALCSKRLGASTTRTSIRGGANRWGNVWNYEQGHVDISSACYAMWATDTHMTPRCGAAGHHKAPVPADARGDADEGAQLQPPALCMLLQASPLVWACPSCAQAAMHAYVHAP